MKHVWCRRAAGWVLLGALTLGTMYFLLPGRQAGLPVLAGARMTGENLVLDAGHGGEDGGAVSLTGVPESGINLSVTLKLDQLLGFYGVPSILLRSEDCSLHDEEAQTLKARKSSDLRNRVKMVEAVENATLISIHQNTFQDSKYHGAQVFYSNAELSLPLATLTQELLRQTLDPSNNRVAAKIPDTVYLMKHITCRAILVECGFLSNPEEDLLLQSDTYQTKISAALMASWLRRGEAAADPTITNEGESP